MVFLKYMMLVILYNERCDSSESVSSHFPRNMAGRWGILNDIQIVSAFRIVLHFYFGDF